MVCDIAYALCKPQCDEKNVSDEEFGRAMGGDVLEKVLDCILEETVDFFPQGRRAVLRKVLEKSQTFAEKAKALIGGPAGGGELDAAIDALLEPELKKLEGTPDEWYWFCFELAGIVGIDARPRTLAELVAMAKGRQRAEWERTAQSRLPSAPTPTATRRSTQKPFSRGSSIRSPIGKPPKVEKPKIKISVECLKGLCEDGGETPDDDHQP